MHRSFSGSSDGGRSSEGWALDSAGDEPGRLPLHPHAGPPHPPFLHHSSASGLPCKDDGLLQSCTEMLSHWILHTANTRYSLEPVKLSLHCWHLACLVGCQPLFCMTVCNMFKLLSVLLASSPRCLRISYQISTCSVCCATGS